jgi:trehalose synthase
METLIEIEPEIQLFNQYKKLTPRIYQKAKVCAKGLRGYKVFHFNSTERGGGVAELLRSQIPLERSLGIDAHWFVMRVDTRFFEVTKKIHNCLQGDTAVVLKKDEQDVYFNTIKKLTPGFSALIKKEKPDCIVIHDPQPLPFIESIPLRTASILRFHIDLSSPNKSTIAFLRPLIERYERIIVSSPDYRPSWLPQKKTKVIMPAIDPFTPKNQPLVNAREMLAFLNINVDHPIVSQVSRFDKWKDPLGVIQSYYIAKNKIPNLQLILAGSHAPDDPEAAEILKGVEKHATGDPDIFLYTHHNDVSINAIQTASDIVMQKSIREGFGLTVTEAMWKERPVIGGKTTGIALQIQHGKNGFMVSTPKEAASVIIRFVQDPRLRARIGKAARKTVQNKFLLSRLVLDHLSVYKDVYKKRTGSPKTA